MTIDRRLQKLEKTASCACPKCGHTFVPRPVATAAAPLSATEEQERLLKAATLEELEAIRRIRQAIADRLQQSEGEPAA